MSLQGRDGFAKVPVDHVQDRGDFRRSSALAIRNLSCGATKLDLTGLATPLPGVVAEILGDGLLVYWNTPLDTEAWRGQRT